MNLNHNPTVEELQDLIEGYDDQAGHHVLWVAKNGDVRVTMVPKGRRPLRFEDVGPDAQLRFETFEAGNEYVGPDAARDREWVRELFDALLTQWPRSQGHVAVASVDQV